MLVNHDVSVRLYPVDDTKCQPIEDTSLTPAFALGGAAIHQLLKPLIETM